MAHEKRKNKARNSSNKILYGELNANIERFEKGKDIKYF